jgi:hypothetical protein
VERDKPKKIGIRWTNFAAVAMETKKGGFKIILDSFHQTSCNCAKFVQPIAIFLAYLIQLDVVVTGNITAKICEVWSEFNIFCTLVGNGQPFLDSIHQT